MTNHPNRSRLNWYEPGFHFREGEKFRGATILKAVKFYHMNNIHPDGPRPVKVIPAMSGFQKMEARPAHDPSRHILLVRIGKGYKVTSAEYQSKSLDDYDIDAKHDQLTSREEASRSFDTLVAQYRSDKRWAEAKE